MAHHEAADAGRSWLPVSPSSAVHGVLGKDYGEAFDAMLMCANPNTT